MLCCDVGLEYTVRRCECLTSPNVLHIIHEGDEGRRGEGERRGKGKEGRKVEGGGEGRGGRGEEKGEGG